MPGHGSSAAFGERRDLQPLEASLFVCELLRSCAHCGLRKLKDQTLGQCFQRAQLYLQLGPAFRDGDMWVP